jgi:hypothetical protein
MKNTFLLTGILVCSLHAQAQSVNIMAGKKVNVVTESKTNMTISALGEEVEMATVNKATAEYVFTSVTEKGYSLRTQLVRMEGSYAGRGVEKTFDTDKEADRNDPMFAGAAALIGKPTEILIEDRKAKMVSGGIVNNPLMTQMGMKDNISELVKFVLYKSDLDQIKTGTRWVDSMQNNELSMLAESEVTGISDTAVEVAVKTTMDIHTTIQQMGMEGKITSKILMNSKRWYNRKSGILIKEEANGTADSETVVMDQRIPMQMKIQSTQIVQ